MPGSIIFKPIEANLARDTDFITKMNPYCVFIVDKKRINSKVCKHGGKNPRWNDVVTVPFPSESKIQVEVMDKDMITKDDQIGSFEIDVSELRAKGKTGEWYPLFYKNKSAGKLLLEASFQDEESTEKDPNLVQPEFIEKEEAATIFEKPVVEEGVKTYVEQRQTVEPQTFLKEVDVVEIRPAEQTIEVMEPKKATKEVQYTEAVPIKKKIETIEPQLVTKEVEVMEPQVVTKTIQVVENVPVKKEVEVIESVPILKEVETLEPQTFTKEVEIIEQVPVMKIVTVTEPVHVKKAAEFVESVITTQATTKEIKPEAIISEEVTQSVGPATYIDEFNELSQKFSQITLTEEEKARYLAMSEEERLKLNEEEKWRWHEARRLASVKA